ncbi:hypothetical protein GCK72_016047 [Caenorhabditis remanei]|uniref:Protein SHQ1 homolog n=1 Tax=Caenorhabditis remanei TaxID=31234 RepID=A0A6A5GVP5_CAERE|nr:hypothetical protein GCK72_016047 [Caenorhabditis remanei]KAF1759580.1 hypothetical protein GCK72_016047 [Caenorhabditis remanei]
MLTPVFWITQDDDSLLIRIRAPHGNLAELDYDHGEYMFVFTCPPYFLRVHFKQMVEEYGSGNGKVEWNSDEGEFHIRVPKIHKSEHFTNLDMITELLNPTTATQPHGRALVEEIEENSEEEDVEDSEGNEFLIDQEIPSVETPKSDTEIKKFGYGFGWTKIGIIERLRGEIGNLVDIQNPEDVEIQMRLDEMTKTDWEAFDEGRYLADTLEPEEELLSLVSAPFSMSQFLEITEEDRMKLKDLRKTKISKIWATNEEIGISLLDILYGYLYDQRVNQWESNCESGWTVAKLSSSLSYFVKFGSVKECVISSIRRSLCYPLYRNLRLSFRILEDLLQILSSAHPTTVILHILCDIHRIFIDSGDFRYILNDLFITDYIFWIQTEDSEDVVRGIQKELEDVVAGIQKADVGWDLEILETEAKMQATMLDSDDDEMPQNN